MIRRTYRYLDGSYVLVTTWLHEGKVYQEIATRPDRHSTWGPPMTLVDTDDDPTPHGGLEVPS